ncbi:MAG: PT domain-containing protein [Bacilli bacterium]|nr:PT domain-containing protein [Bacilli bacterium]
MKLNKILALSAIFACGLTLAACNQTPTEQPTDQPTTEQPTTVEPTTEQPTTEEPTTEVPPSEAPAFNAAAAVAESVYVTYKDDVLRMEDFKLPTKQITYDDNDNMVVVDLAWELVFVDGIEGAVTAGEIDADGNANFHVVYDAEHSTEVTNFKLICKVTDANGNEETIELNYNVPAFKYASYQEFAEAATAQSSDVLNVAGTVVAVYKSGVYLIDAQGYGFYAYSPVFEGTMDQNSLLAAYPIGSKVIASGTAALYNGQYEFAKGCSVKLVEAGSDYVIPYQDATEAFASAVSAKDKAALDHLQNTVVSINDITIADIDAANYYYYFTVGESNVKFYLRTSGSFNDFTNEKVNEIVKEWTEGYKANIKGLVTVYSGSYYITPIELDAVEITSRTLSDQAKIDIALGAAEREYGTTFTSGGEYELPATDENGVAYTYEVLSGETIKVENGKLVVTPAATNTQNTLKVTATLGELVQSVEIVVEVASSKMDLVTANELAALGEGAKGQFYYGGIVTEVANTKYGNMYIQDQNGNTFYVYGLYDGANNRYDAMENAPQVGDYVVVYDDEVGAYNGSLQLVNAVLVGNFGPAEDNNAEFVTASKITELGAGLTENNQVVEGTYSYTVSGLVQSVANAKYGNITIEDAEGNTIYVYGTFDPNGGVPTYNVNDYVVIKADCISYYKGVQIKNATVVGLYDATEKKVEITAPEAPAIVDVELNVTGATVYTEGTITLGDYAVAFNENGTLVYASRLVGGYGGPADGFYHDGSYVRKDGEQCGMFNIDEVFQSWGECGGQGQVEYKGQMVSPWNAYEVVVPAGWTVVTGTWAEMASVMQAIDPAAVEDGNYFVGVEDGAFNGYAYSTKVDAPAVEITGDLLASFDFGDNGEAKHVDGNELAEGTSYEVGGYTLTLTGLSKVYGPAFDAQGNSAIKLGTSSKVGTFTFTVDASVNTVVINAACYKANASKITINGVEYELKGLSNEGTYDQIVIDTSTNKEVVLSTVSGACRAMVNSIELYGENAVSAEPVQLNASTLEVGDITEETTFGTFTIKATAEKKVTIDENSKSHDGVDYTQRIKLGGSGTADYRNITFSTEGACTITVIALSSSSGEDRELALFAADGTQIATGVAQGAPTDAKVSVITYTITEAGTFYIASLSGGVNIYSIVVE